MIYRRIGVTAAAGGLSRALTVIIPFVVARVFGLGVETDAFFLAAAVVLFWSTSIAVILETAVVTRVVAAPAAAVWKWLAAMGLRFSAVAAVVAVAVLGLSALVPDAWMDPGLRRRAQQLFAELSPLLFLGVWSSLLTGYLNAHRRFGRAAAAPTLIGVSVLGSLFFLSGTLGVHALVVGYLAGESARLVYLWAQCARGPAAAGPDARRKAPPGPQDAGLNLQWISFVLIGLNPVVDRLLASGLAGGSVSALALIERLYLIPGGLMTWAVLPVVTTYWARLAPRERAVRRHILGVLALALAAGAAVAAALALVHGPLLHALFEAPGAPWPHAGSRAFLWLLAGLPFHLCVLALWRAAIILRRPAGPLLGASAGVFVLNLAGDLAVVGSWGLPGLTAVTAATTALYALVLWAVCRL